MNKESTTLEKVNERLPTSVDLEYEVRMTVYDGLKPFMDAAGLGDYTVVLRSKSKYYKVYLESLGGDTYSLPDEYIDKYIDRYKPLTVTVGGEGDAMKGIRLEYEVDTD